MKVSNLLARLLASAAIAVGTAAQAAPMEAVTVTDLTTGISNQSAPIVAVATAVLGLHLVVKVYKWIRRAMS